MTRHQRTVGRKRVLEETMNLSQPESLSEESDQSQPNFTQSDVKEHPELVSPPRSYNSRPNRTGSEFTPVDQLLQLEDGLPKLLFEDLQSDELEVVIQALVGLFGQLDFNPSLQKKNKALSDFIGMGGHSIVLLTMRKGLRKWPQHGKIQAKCCSCLASLIHHWQYDTTLITVNIVEHLNKMGALELVVAALDRFPQDVNVLSAGVCAMTNLCYNFQNLKQARDCARRLCCDLNGVQIVVNAMKEFPLQCRLQQLGCWYFRRMCTLGLEKEPVMKTEALVAIATAVQTFPNQADIQIDAYNAMTAIMKPTP